MCENKLILTQPRSQRGSLPLREAPRRLRQDRAELVSRVATQLLELCHRKAARCDQKAGDLSQQRTAGQQASCILFRSARDSSGVPMGGESPADAALQGVALVNVTGDIP